ncbi:hypothetical protein [Paraburkholderia ferrariae]|uniref:hypothetical protein n=1 Tax=Paraburkholderia ferrariae TaxID=386056 RepID=UPI0004819959|nr:hypothetical protein [Paraburkholderia ferrariae]
MNTEFSTERRPAHARTPNRGWSLATNYANGSVPLSAGYLTLRNPLQTALGGQEQLYRRL